MGLPDKAVSEARERVRTALTSMAIALPSRRITVNLSPADLPKEGSHFDLPIALALLAAIDILPHDEVARLRLLGKAINGVKVNNVIELWEDDIYAHRPGVFWLALAGMEMRR